MSGSGARQGTGAGDSHLRRHLYHYHLPRSHYERGVDPALRRAEKMLPLSIKDDEYKPPKFNLFRKISGWFRCGELCLREVGVRHEGRRPKSKDGPRSREGATGTPRSCEERNVWTGRVLKGDPASGSGTPLTFAALPRLYLV